MLVRALVKLCLSYLKIQNLSPLLHESKEMLIVVYIYMRSRVFHRIFIFCCLCYILQVCKYKNHLSMTKKVKKQWIYGSEGVGVVSHFLKLYQPPNFQFHCILGHFFGSWSFIKAKKIRLFLEKFRRNFGIFHKIHKTPKISIKIGSKTSKWSKFGLILPFPPKNSHLSNRQVGKKKQIFTPGVVYRVAKNLR